MRAIKARKINTKHRFDCERCLTTLEVDTSEMKFQADFRSEGAYTFVCCICRRTNWVDASLVRQP
jgi:hypothetical protein